MSEEINDPFDTPSGIPAQPDKKTLRLADGYRAEVQRHEDGMWYFFYNDNDPETGVFSTLLRGHNRDETLYQGIYDYDLPSPHDAEDYAAFQNWLENHKYDTDDEDPPRIGDIPF